MPEIIQRYLQAAERHIVTGQLCIARQRALIARLECHEGHEELLREAGKLLAQFLKIQTLHLADRDRLICELSRATTDWRIAQGQSQIVQQRDVISRLESSDEESELAKDQLALLEGTQTALLAHRDRLDEMGVEGAEGMCRVQATLLWLLRTSMAG